MKRYYFFTLCDPRDPNKVRYIGSTTENLNVRLSKIISECLNTEKSTLLFDWVRELFDLSLRPLINLIEVSERTTEDLANDRQRELIEAAQKNGECDLNMTKGRGTQSYTYEHKPETKEKISETMQKDLDLELIADLRMKKVSWKNIAKELDIAYMTAYSRKEEVESIIESRGRSDESV
jgi:hypothetical protein